MASWLAAETRQRLVALSFRAFRALLGLTLAARLLRRLPVLAAEAEYQAFLGAREPEPTPRLGAADGAPAIDVLMPLFEAPLAPLEAALASLRAQSFPSWRLLIADAGPAESPGSRAAVRAAAADPRIRILSLGGNRGIAGNLNAALAEARAEWIALFDQDDLLAPDALAAMAVELKAGADVVYSDKDNVTPWGDRYAPYFKPDFSPHLLLASNYVTHLTLARRALVFVAGGFDAAMDGAQDWDLFLRLAERTARFVHVPRVLYHWRSLASSAASSLAAKPWAREAQRRAVQAALDRRGIGATVEIDAQGTASFRARSDESSGLLVFQDPALKPCGPDWLAELALWARRPEVGAACAPALDGRGRVACAGLALVEGRARPLFAGARLERWTPLGRPSFLRDVLAPTPGAVVLRRDVFERLGGPAPLDARAAMDLGLKIQRAGLSTVLVPSAAFTCAPGATFASDATWAGSDPSWNPQLDPRSPLPRPRADAP